MTTKTIPNLYPTNSLNKNTALVLNSNSMDDSEKPRSIRFPQWLWDEIDRDANRCRRSSVKQMEVVLAAYYRGEVPQVDATKLAAMGIHDGIQFAGKATGTSKATADIKVRKAK